MQEPQKTWVQSLSQEDPLEKEMATHSTILAWEIPWTEEPGRLYSMRLQRVRHNLKTKQQHSHLGAQNHWRLWHFLFIDMVRDIFIICGEVYFLFNIVHWMFVLSHSVMSNSLQRHGLQPARFLCPWGFSRQEYWSMLPCSSPGGLPDPGIESTSPTFEADSLPSEPPEKPISVITDCHYKSSLLS